MEAVIEALSNFATHLKQWHQVAFGGLLSSSFGCRFGIGHGSKPHQDEWKWVAVSSVHMNRSSSDCRCNIDAIILVRGGVGWGDSVRSCHYELRIAKFPQEYRGKASPRTGTGS